MAKSTLSVSFHFTCATSTKSPIQYIEAQQTMLRKVVLMSEKLSDIIINEIFFHRYNYHIFNIIYCDRASIFIAGSLKTNSGMLINYVHSTRNLDRQYKHVRAVDMDMTCAEHDWCARWKRSKTEWHTRPKKFGENRPMRI